MTISWSPNILYVCLSQVVFLKEKLEQLEKALQEQQAEQQLLPVQVQANQATNLDKSDYSYPLSSYNTQHQVALHLSDCCCYLYDV